MARALPEFFILLEGVYTPERTPMATRLAAYDNAAVARHHVKLSARVILSFPLEHSQENNNYKLPHKRMNECHTPKR
jgi:hypothetical protein